MMRLFHFDVKFEYVKGQELVIADTLSRAIAPKQQQEDHIMNIAIDPFEEIPDTTLQEVKEHTDNDSDLQELIKIILNGWPNNKNEVPDSVKPYFSIRDTLSVSDGIILKAERILVPKSLRADIKKRLHCAHLGYESMLRRAKMLIFWIGMPDIRL